jgi:hypothetical protein
MQKIIFELLDLLYGELDVEEDRLQGKIVYRFISYDDLNLSMLYYPGNQELVTRQSIPEEFNSYIPIYEDEVKKYYSEWLKEKFSNKIRIKGVKFISFI